jgi:acyl-CoA oxidase
MVIARLIDGDGVDRGVHNFLVPLRSMDTHMLLPGVTTGDIGPKIGYNVMDNGFARFENVIIPRRNMAMRFAHVNEQGKYSKKSVSDATSKVAYITMMQVRAYICNEASKNLAIACTIVIRYSAVRRQGYREDGITEHQILDYTQQQHRLFPLLAASYCFFFTGKKLLEQLKEIEQKIASNGNVSKEEVADLHASTSAHKSFTTTVTADGIEDCRKACGGHGFLQCSALPELITSYLQNPTVEGDNQMLPQQVVKVLLKLVQAVQGGDDLSAYDNCESRYLIPSLKSIIQSYLQDGCGAACEADLLDLQVILQAFRHRASRLLVEAANGIQTSVMGGKTMEDAWNEGLVQMARASRGYSVFLLLNNFVKGINDEERRVSFGPNEVAVLRDLARLFGLYWIEKEMGDFLEDGYLSAAQAHWIRSNVLKLLKVIRPNAVALVDARDFSDFRLKSALGRFDGDVYTAIMEAAKRDPLNQTEPGPGYEEHLNRLIVDGVGVYTGTASRL